ncbi:MAG TPA: GWxTD domain-containing protein [Candidatus Polarisedimenticolia bacterium]|nr:GWxTD domain-containing protein [Candidatus Polarisedimenticolia bacterium]
MLTAALLPAALAVGVHAFAEHGDRKARRAERRQALAAIERGEYDLPTRYWREGPVRYLMSQEEDRSFRGLDSEKERESYIRRFWAARDPDPSTPGNPFRDLFYRRVAEASAYFSASTRPGWLTDQGKVFIILGPPDEQEERYYRQNTPAVVLWTYREPPGGGSVSPNSVIRFVRDYSGEFRLSSEYRLSANETALSIGLQVQAMQVKSLPQPSELLDAVVSARPETGTSAMFRTRQEFFGGGAGETVAILTLGVLQEALFAGSGAGGPENSAGGISPRLEAVARLIRDGGEGLTYDLAGVNGLRAGTGDAARDAAGYLLFQGGMPVAPGRYAAYFGVFDRLTGHIYSHRDAFEVPSFPGDHLGVSAIALASRLERLSDRSSFGYSAPFVFGDLRAVPRADANLDSNERLLIYYQVHGAGIDAIDGRPDFNVEYRVRVARGIGPDREPMYVPFGNPINLSHLQNPVQGHSFELTDWPPATYRLEVEVTDNLSGERSVTETTISVE